MAKGKLVERYTWQYVVKRLPDTIKEQEHLSSLEITYVFTLANILAILVSAADNPGRTALYLPWYHCAFRSQR